MRCRICDFSPTAPSEYRNGLQVHNPNVRLKPDKKHGGFLCSGCHSAVSEAIYYDSFKDDMAFGEAFMLTKEWDA